MAALPQLVSQLDSGEAVSADVVGISSRAHALAAGRQAGTGRAAAEGTEEEGDGSSHAAPPPPPPAARPRGCAVTGPCTEAAGPAGREALDPGRHAARHLRARDRRPRVHGAHLLAREAKLPEPHALPEEVYRACHTLSGSSKMAQARHGIRLAEPLDHWLRRAFGSGLGLSDRGPRAALPTA